METLLAIIVFIEIILIIILSENWQGMFLRNVLGTIALILLGCYILISCIYDHSIGYKSGQIDALNDKFKYKIEVKHTFIDSELVSTDTIYVEIKQ